MSDDTPTLMLSGSEVWQYAQAFNALLTVAARVRIHRERQGRLAFADDEHAGLVHEARRCPPLRVMTDAEQADWSARLPPGATVRQGDEPMTVWTARLADPAGHAGGEWGVQAHAWDSDGRAAGSLLAVVRDADDAIELTQHLRAHGTAAHLARLADLARNPHRAAGARPAALDVAGWEQALRRHLPTGLAGRVIVADPSHPHHSAWRELQVLAAAEWSRGADLDRLAHLVATIPSWRRGAQNPPALAHWAITQARAAPGYAQAVAQPWPEPAPEPAADGPRRRLREVRTPAEAMVWARGLEPADPAHRLEAGLGFGRWGGQVDAALAQAFPGLVESARVAARTRRAARVPGPARPEPREVAERRLIAAVDRMDPARRGDRSDARSLLGTVSPALDRRIADRFATDPDIQQTVGQLYPDGWGEEQAEAWRARADATGAVATTDRTVPDDPHTRRREDLDGAAAATPQDATAAHQRGVAAAVARPPAEPRPATPRRTR